MKRSKIMSERSKVDIPDLRLPVINDAPPPPRLSMDRYASWILELIAIETPEQRERRLNRPMPVGERFEIKN